MLVIVDVHLVAEDTSNTRLGSLSIVFVHLAFMLSDLILEWKINDHYTGLNGFGALKEHDLDRLF